DDVRYLFTTKTCPNCKMVKEKLAKENIPYVVIDAEENVELRDKYSIMQAPTLVVVENGVVQKYAGAAAVTKYINSLKVQA
ncbi:MAG: thioredoxin family protein, partial [Lachnospiraceae bacterium]|nr:thioredoxin family protein [Lachnospiraceae bacterium]